MTGQYCFVLMPFGKKADPGGGAPIDFDKIFREVLVPAIREAGLEPHRDDFVAMGGLVQKGIFEALLLCDYAIADLTTANPNVLYELGIRHAVRPSSTLTLSAKPDAIPFDVSDLRVVRYQLNRKNRLTPSRASALHDDVVRELTQLRKHVFQRAKFSDSPLFQLIEGWQTSPPESLRTDLFADRVKMDESVKAQLAALRRAGTHGSSARDEAATEAVSLERSIGDLSQAETGILVDLLLTYRALEQWDAMVQLVAKMPGYLRDRALVQEQWAFALNRRAKSEDERQRAMDLLTQLDDQGRSTAETFGLMGRIHKDRWRLATDPVERKQHLDDAIKAYRRGFSIDSRDPYPGINFATLLSIKGTARALRRLAEILPVVEFSAQRLKTTDKPTYWVHATLMEIAVLRGQQRVAMKELHLARMKIRERWEPATTAQNLRDLVDAGNGRGEDSAWIAQIVRELEALADQAHDPS